MPDLPTVYTDRLVLRPFDLEDALRVQKLAGEWEIAKTTVNIPHPYEDGMAEAWIGGHQRAYEAGEAVNLAVVRRVDDVLIGAVGVHLNQQHRVGEIGYWVGVPYWNRGYGTEAARALVQYSFDILELNRIQARHMTSNPASGRVMQKIGMTHEGTLRQAIFRWDTYEDVEMYSVLKVEYDPK
jgi:RimJ/RimL family protein N-acetyltransferase